MKKFKQFVKKIFEKLVYKILKFLYNEDRLRRYDFFVYKWKFFFAVARESDGRRAIWFVFKKRFKINFMYKFGPMLIMYICVFYIAFFDWVVFFFEFWFRIIFPTGISFGVICVFFPFLGSFVILLFGSFFSFLQILYIVFSSLFVSVFCAFFMLYGCLVKGCSVITFGWQWFSVLPGNICMCFIFDSLSIVMLVLVSTVSLAVHGYSVFYMKKDPYFNIFMGYLLLFTFFMLFLVSAGNFIQFFIGWEGVGLCSFLLIGFWTTKLQAAKAAIKAILVNRIGDSFLLSGILLLYYYFGTLNFNELLIKVQLLLIYNSKHIVLILDGMVDYKYCVLTAAFCLFIGAMAKSSQFGLHTWLPDAMEGPTPVSALIHAATMVTAGVFLLLRCSFLFEIVPIAKNCIVVVGGLTCFVGGLFAIVQIDCKKLIAYSTMSQLGYMVMGCGFNLQNETLFHLVLHGYAKALMFLAAGGVIHFLNGEQSFLRMGGLGTHLPFTFIMQLVGSFSLMGFPGFSCFYSKETLLMKFVGFGYLGWWAFIVGIFSILFTVVYCLKLLILMFFGKIRFSCQVYRVFMNDNFSLWYYCSLSLLALGSLFGGVFLLGFFEELELFSLNFLHGSFTKNMFSVSTGIFIQFVPIFVIVVGFIIAADCWLLKFKKQISFNSISNYFSVNFFSYQIERILLQGLGLDQIYNNVFVKNILNLSEVLYLYVECGFFEWIGPQGFFQVFRYLARWHAAYIQVGSLHVYLCTMVFSFFLFLFIYFFD